MDSTGFGINFIKQPELTVPPPRPVTVVNNPSPVGSPLPEGANTDERYAHNERVSAAGRAFGQSQTPQPYSPSERNLEQPQLPRGLQEIIDKVLSGSTRRSERQSAATVAASALSGIAAQGLQRQGSMNQTRMTEAGLMQRLPITGQQAMEQKALGEIAATERQRIASALGGMEQRRKSEGVMPVPKVKEIEDNWWELNKDKMWNWE